MMSSVVVIVPINNPDGDDRNMQKTTEKHDRGKKLCSFVSKNVGSIKEKIIMKCEYDRRKMVHSIKVGIALVLVSLLYLLDPLFQQVGQNAMWAIMTVVVVFEFFAGATLSKGINRGIGTILGGLLGCFAAILADQLPGIRSAFVVAISVFVISGAATYSRLVPKIKRKFDYGVMIFILTFNLVVVSGVRADKVMKLARERLSTIGMGFSVCIFTSLLIFPEWASDELHSSTAAKFDKIASSLQRCLEEYFMIPGDEKESRPSADVSGCKAVLHSKSNEESLANFAKWEPWHGKFGFSYPWEKYMEIGESLRELAAIVISLNGCIQSSAQPSPTQREIIKEPCEVVGVSMVWILKEIGESIKEMKLCRAKVTIIPKLLSMKQDNLNLVKSPPDLGMATIVFLLNEMVEKVEVLAIKVEQLGDIAGFHTKKLEA